MVMEPPKPPKITAVEVTAAQPTEADSAAIANLSTKLNKSLPQVVYIVTVQLKTKLPATGLAWALYVNDERIPKYWEYRKGVYFTVIDPEFFTEHRGKRLRFSLNGVDFPETGMKLAVPTVPAAASKSKAKKAKSKTAGLPTQEEILK
jgi:hypothetical protein